MAQLSHTKSASLGSFGDAHFERDVHHWNNDRRRDGNLPFTNASTTQWSPSQDCNLCIIEAPGGVSLIYWAPDDLNGTSTGNGTINDNQDIPFTRVEDGFTLYFLPSLSIPAIC